MPSNKAHHYVPQFYFRNFSRDSRSISLYSLATDRVVSSASIKKQCQRSYLYGRDGNAEKALAKMEGAAAGILRNILKLRTPPTVLSSDHIGLMFYIATQTARTVYAGQERDEHYEQLMKHLIRPTLPSDGITPEGLDKIRIALTDPVGEALRTTIPMYPMLLDLRGVVLQNATATGFVTSDNPVVLYNQLLEERRYASNTGLQSVGLQIYLPISADVAVLFYDRAVYGVGRRNPESIILDNLSDVSQLNALQFLNSAENIYFDDRRNVGHELSHNFKNVQGHRRSRKMNLVSQRESPIKPDQTRELVGFFREDVRNGLNLTFMKVLKRSTAAREELMSRIAVRDPALCEMYDKFQELVRQGKYQAGDFFTFAFEAN
jgi:hypothetical protein